MQDRRTFIKRSLLTTASAVAVPYFFSSETLFANGKSDRLRMGCIGVGSMGKGDAHSFNRLVDIVAVCDVDSAHTDQCLHDDKIGPCDKEGKKIQPLVYKDYRAVLDREDIDVVSIVTPDHWHVKIAIEALQAGKHVFCQKPLTLTIEENKLIRAAAAKYDRKFQIGTWQRSQRDQFMTATLMVRAGLLGEIKRIVCDIGGSPSCGAIPEAPVPESLDFNMWLGQAPLTTYLATPDGKEWPTNSRTHYEFRWWYEYSGGKFTDWGAHHIDCALWALDYQRRGQGPSVIRPDLVEHPVPYKDGMPTLSDRYNTATKFDIACLFNSGVEMRVVSNSPDGNGILFEGSKGRIHVNRQRIKGAPFDAIKKDLASVFPEEKFMAINHGKKATGDHMGNFIDCIKEGGTPASDVPSHIETMNICHLCGIAARLNRKINWDPEKEIIIADDQATTFMAREQRKGFELPAID